MYIKCTMHISHCLYKKKCFVIIYYLLFWYFLYNKQTKKTRSLFCILKIYSDPISPITPPTRWILPVTKIWMCSAFLSLDGTSVKDCNEVFGSLPWVAQVNADEIQGKSFVITQSSILHTVCWELSPFSMESLSNLDFLAALQLVSVCADSFSCFCCCSFLMASLSNNNILARTLFSWLSFVTVRFVASTKKNLFIISSFTKRTSWKCTFALHSHKVSQN